MCHGARCACRVRHARLAQSGELRAVMVPLPELPLPSPAPSPAPIHNQMLIFFLKGKLVARYLGMRQHLATLDTYFLINCK